jgi:two-component system, OmpR family, sensor kinase
MRRFREVRNRLLLIVVLALAFALAAATLGFNVLLAHSTARDADAFLRQRADSELALLQVVNGRIRFRETADDTLSTSRIWIFQGNQPLEAPASRPETAATARALVNGPGGFHNVRHRDERLYAVPITDSGRRVGTLVAGMSLAPYERTRELAMIASLAFAVALLAIVGFAVWWLLRSALRPVAQMTEQAAAWSETDLDRRFDLGEPHDELSRLGATLDALLDRIAASLRHERLFSNELSHELRTPLAKLIAEAELALRRNRSEDDYRAALSVVLANAEQLASIVETLVSAARHESEPSGVADAAHAARRAAESCSELAEERAVELTVADPPAVLRVGVDLDFAERILHPVLENACLYGRRRVHMSVARADHSVLFTVDDDGPGIAEDEQESIFEPAARGTAGRDAGTGAGLGLALARRLARAASGDVIASASARGGRFVIRLPAA